MNFQQNQQRPVVPQFGQSPAAPSTPPQGAPAPRPFGAPFPGQQPQRPAGPGFMPGRPGMAPAPAVPQFPTQQTQQRPAFRGGPAQGPAVARNQNPFAGVEQVQARKDANYDRTGDYLMRIDSVQHIVGRQDGLNKIIVKKTTLAVLSPAEDGMTHRIGEQTVHAIKENPAYNYFLPEVKAFVANVIGCPEEAVTEEMIWEICDEAKNPLGGVVVECSNRFKQTQRTLIVIKNYKRRLRALEIQQEIAPDVVARFFPGDTLQRMAMSEGQEAAQPAPFQGGQQPAPFGGQQPAQLPPPPQGYYPPQQNYQQ